MKKILSILSVSMLLVVAACGSNTSDSNQENVDSEQENTDVKSVLLDFQSEIVRVLKGHNEQISAYESAKLPVTDSETPKEEKPSTEELEELKASAVEASEATVEEIKELKIPGELDDSKAEIQSALDELVKAYEVRAEQASTDDPTVQEKASEHFTKFENQMGSIFEDAGLIKPSFAKELE